MATPTYVQALIDRGVPPDDARIISDLAEHAASESAKAISRVANTAPPHLQASIFLAALKLAAKAMDETVKEATRGILAEALMTLASDAQDQQQEAQP